MPTTIKIPHNFSSRPYQLPYLKSKKRFRIAVWHRRSGKSKTALNDQIIQLHLRPGIYYYFLPTYKQAKQVIWDSLIKQHVPYELVEKVNDSELAIYWKNGSIQRFVGCEDPQAHRGINPIGVVFDEYSEMDEAIWTEIIQPVLRENKGTATFIFTFRGRNHAWNLYQQAKGNEQWFSQILTVEDTQAISKEELLEAEKNTPRAFFRQEYYCDPEENASAFFRRINENTYSNSIDHQGHSIQLGVDLAKYQDWTVITPFCMTCFKSLPQERFNQVDWNLQKSRIEASYWRYVAGKAVVDGTGVGDPIVEDLERMGLSIESFKFSGGEYGSRRQLLNNLAILLEQDKIKTWEDEGLTSELKAMVFRMKEVSSGVRTITKLEVGVPENMTDDRVMSLALSVWGVVEPIKAKTENYDIYGTNWR